MKDEIIVDDIFTQSIPDLYIYDDAVTTSGNSKMVSKAGIKRIIDHLMYYYVHYDEYYEPLYKKIIEKYEQQKNSNEKPLPEKDKRGFVYILKNMGYYKIGRCSHNKTRLGEYTKLPETPVYELMMYVTDCYEVEAGLHEMFAEKRLRDGRCEWFTLTDGDIEKAHAYAFQFITPMD